MFSIERAAAAQAAVAWAAAAMAAAAMAAMVAAATQAAATRVGAVQAAVEQADRAAAAVWWAMVGVACALQGIVCGGVAENRRGCAVTADAGAHFDGAWTGGAASATRATTMCAGRATIEVRRRRGAEARVEAQGARAKVEAA